ncbi:MAG: RluA family pseudouridine synthase [Pseudomonadota bacterium]
MKDPLDDDEPPEDGAPEPVLLTVTGAEAGQRLDKALAALAPPGLSRSRLRALIEDGAVAGPDGQPVRDPRAGVKAGEVWTVSLPVPAPATPQPEAIPLEVVYEDAYLIVVNKPAGMVVHPAPGSPSGTLVNALLHHCAGSLSGVGGELRPGIVHRIDKDTSGLLVAAKCDAAHQGLAEQFAAHDMERAYLAICWGAPDARDARLMGLDGVTAETGGWLRVEGRIDRHPGDRKRMAVVRRGGRRAVTHLRVDAVAGPIGHPAAARLECRLETGRTHQIRVHLAWMGHPLVGDAVYGRGSRSAPGEIGEAAQAALEGFPRQALHAATLGFSHPVTGEPLRFEADPPEDMTELMAALGW